jgi:hypothetical protein
MQREMSSLGTQRSSPCGTNVPQLIFSADTSSRSTAASMNMLTRRTRCVRASSATSTREESSSSSSSICLLILSSSLLIFPSHSLVRRCDEVTFITQEVGDLGECAIIRRLIAVEMSNDVTFVRIQGDQITGRGQFNHRPFDLFANEIEESIDLSKKTRDLSMHT